MSVRDDVPAMDDHTRRLLEWIAANENRRRVVHALAERPRNANQLATAPHLHYRTITHHLRRLTSHGVVTAAGARYGRTYVLAEHIAPHVTGEHIDGANADGPNTSGPSVDRANVDGLNAVEPNIGGANADTTEERDVD